jgi:hypothetical protein
MSKKGFYSYKFYAPAVANLRADERACVCALKVKSLLFDKTTICSLLFLRTRNSGAGKKFSIILPFAIASSISGGASV